eukprot:TRINITY_DN54916_c0_g1_i1.p1 TRINITY_DN54916_c0_g1~~TRINITY_DN54916_c0_g1_i1.p1  ORF type:complete len:449 (-),score=118.01 TRINITY_DN54916_c0_g1_i1:53-1399(-)
MRMHTGLSVTLFLLLGGNPRAAGSEDQEPIPDKVGAEIHLTKQERSTLKKLECSMCKAIISEMHIEAVKHSMTAGGAGAEDRIWETSNAICLALLQKYRLQPGPKPSLEPKGEDDDEAAMAEASAAGNGQDFMRAMLVLKMGCQQWVEDYGGDTSGFVYKSVKEGSQSAGGAAQDFCVRSVGLCGAGKKERQKKEKAKEKERLDKRNKMVNKQEAEEEKEKKKDPMSALPEDSKFGIQRMLEMARDDPLHYLDDDAKDRIRKARSDLRCSVCHRVLSEAHAQVAKRPKSLQSEHDLLTVLETSCEGGKDLSVPSYFGVEPPPLPPEWTDHWRPKLDKKSGRYVLKPFPKKAGKVRQKWRKQAANGQQKPPSAPESEADMMLTMTCKDILEPERLSEKLFEAGANCQGKSCDAASVAASQACHKEAGEPCSFEDMGLASSSTDGGKEEL